MNDHPRWVEPPAWVLAIVTVAVAVQRLWQVLP